MAATANVSFGYDAAGNRTSMTDGLGSVTYNYNELSQLTSEARTFSGVSGTFDLSYAYNLAGELTSITNEWGAQVGYSYDKTGRLIGVTGSVYAGGADYVNNITYRAFGLKEMSYTNGKTLSLKYDNRMRMTEWHTPGVMQWDYSYTNFGENTGRVTYAKNLDDGTLDRSYDYDHVGRMWASHSGKEARWHIGQESYTGADGPYAYNNSYDQWGNITARNGWGVANASYTASYTNNRRVGFSYDAAGNVTNDGSQSYTYDATGQQATASGSSTSQSYDGDRLRTKKTENGVTTYYLRSAVLGGQVVAEINSSSAWTRGYVYLGGQMVAIQGGSGGAINTVHQDPVTKSQRITNSSGTVVSTVDLDPWGAETGRSSNQAFQPHRYTSYERDANGGDDAMMRRYQSSSSRFSQPDPYDGSYNLTDPQSLNRYAYTQNDPVNFIDPSGLTLLGGNGGWSCSGTWSALLWPDGTITNFHITSMNCTSSGGGGGDFRTWDFSEDEILQTMMNLLENPRCSTFISNLIDVARQLTGRDPYSYDARDLIARISTQPSNSHFEGVDFPNGYNFVDGILGSAFGNLGSGEASVYMSSSARSNSGRETAQVYLGLVGLHETIHLAGGARSVRDGSQGYYSDEVLARAASILTKAPGFPELGSKNAAYGAYWGNQLNEHCSPWSSNQ